MGFRRRVKFYLVHSLSCRNKEAESLIREGKVEINGIPVHENVVISDLDEIRVNGKISRKRKELVYLKFHKPAGFQSTLNAGVDDNLSEFFVDFPGLSIAGRLDKASEGLLLLSNDGDWV